MAPGKRASRHLARPRPIITAAFPTALSVGALKVMCVVVFEHSP